MNNRYIATFNALKKEGRIAFCPFAMLGDPNEEGTMRRIKTYLAAGADMLEVGIPFSDPIADGPTIQAATQRALDCGTSPKRAFAMIKKIRSITDVPISVLTYANLVVCDGVVNFYTALRKAGADSILIADVPLEEASPFISAARRIGLSQIFLVSEYTDARRLLKLEKATQSGYLYITGALGVTGARKKLHHGISSLIKTIKKNTTLPLLVGFGISSTKHVLMLKHAGADGVIIGSSLIDCQKSKLLTRARTFKKACS